ncbi:MAG TPA: hypothetical protein VFQ61_16380 [Polyangiaceae bacterium]|nr:hypothetical protein [Polyangiaceae bacterium]
MQIKVIGTLSWPDISARRPFAELTFHVLAHVPNPTPGSLYDPAYIARVATWLGAASDRTLGEDVRLLVEGTRDFAGYARIQNLAWLFATPEQAQKVAAVDITALTPTQVEDPSALAALCAPAWQGLKNTIELLRCAITLESAVFQRLPSWNWSRDALRDWLRRVRSAAPSLDQFRISTLRSLGWRGRVRGREIWIGEPFESGPSVAHLAFQAAHEASVAELNDLDCSERERESAALVLFAQRARAAGLAQEHAKWLQHFGGTIGTDPVALRRELRDAVEQRLRTASDFD